MQKSKSYIIISLLLVASMLMSAMAPMLQEPVTDIPEAVVLDIPDTNTDGQSQDDENNVINTQVEQQNLPTESDTETVLPTSENEGNSVVTDPVGENVEKNNDTVEGELTDNPVDNTDNGNLADTQNTNETNGSISGQNENQNENEQVDLVENIESTKDAEDNNGVENGVLEGQEEQSGEQQEQQSESENTDTEMLSSAVSVSVAAVEGKPEFQVTISNNGEANLSEISVDSSATVAYNSTGTVRAASGKFTAINGEAVEESKASYKIASLEAGQSVDLTYSVDLPVGFSMANINSVITVNASYLDGEETKAIAASNSGTAVVTGTELQFANLSVSLTDEKDGYYFPGEAILHQVVISNEGEFDVSNVEVNYAGLSAENYEDIPCVFTSVCLNGECETIPQEKQDSNYTVDSITAGQFASLYCENGVNDSYSENVSYYGSVNVNATANDKEDGTVPADYNVSAQSNSVAVEVVVPLAQPAQMRLMAAPLRAPLLGATPQAYIFAVDCVETTCFTQDDFTDIPMYVSFQNTATDGSYCSVTMTSDGLAGSFTKFGRGTNGQNIRTISLSNVSSPSGSYTFTDIAPGDVVVAVFEADLSQSQTYTPSQDYYFKFNASVNNCSTTLSTSTQASKASCDPQPGFYGIASSACVEPGSTTAVHTIKIINNGDTDICQLLGRSRASGTFAESGAARLIYNERIPKGSSKTFTFNQTVNSSTASDVEFTFAGTGCDTTTEVSATVTSSFEYCAQPEPEIDLGIKPPTKCHEKNSGSDSIALELKNTGAANLCKAQLHVAYKYNNAVVYEQDVTVPNAFLTAGATQTVYASFNPETYNIPFGKSYTVVATLKGFVDGNNDGACDTTAAREVESSATIELCELTPDLQVSVDPVPDCHEPKSGTSDEFTVHVKNTGEKDLCQVVLTAEYKYNNQTVSTESKIISAADMTAGASKDVIFSFNPDQYNIPGSATYTFHVTAKAYDGEGSNCGSTPVVTKEGQTTMETCEEKVPDMSVDINIPAACHEPGSGADTFAVSIKNTGTKDLCSATIKYEFTYNGQQFYSETVQVPESLLKAGRTGNTTYSVNPDIYNIPAGATYTINATLTAYDGENGTCEQQPAVTSSDQGEKDICEKPGMTIDIEEKPECHPTGSSEEEFVVDIKNTGDTDLCSAVVKGWFEYNGQTVLAETKEVPANLLVAGSEGKLSFYFTPEQYGIKQGENYTFHAQLLAYTDTNNDGTCDTDPVIDLEKTTGMEICPEKPGMTIDIEEKPECHPTGSGEEEFVVDIKNTGETNLCSAVVEGRFEYNGQTVYTEAKEVPANLLVAGSEGTLSFLFNPDQYGIRQGESYTFHAHLLAYIDSNGDGTCDTDPVVDVEKTADMDICTEEPGMTIDIEEKPECHPTGSGPEEFVVDIKNTGEADLCSAIVEGRFEYNGQIVRTETKEVPAELLVGGKVGSLTFLFDPEQYGIGEGESYTFYAHLVAYVDADNDGTCDNDPVVDVEKSTDMSMCTEEPPKLTAYNMNNSCYDGDEVQYFKGVIDIPEGADIQSIDVYTNQVQFASQKYDCVITKVMNVGDGVQDFVEIAPSEQGTSYHFENLVPGKNTAGFICEAKLDSNQVGNGRKISFSASSMANYADKEIEVESNEVVDSQNCVRVRKINLPATGDDTNMPFLIGGFALLVILAGGSTFAIKKRKDNSTAK